MLTVGTASMLIEISNTFLNFTYYLRYHGQEQNLIYKLNGVVFLISFFVVRVIYFGFCILKAFELLLLEDFSINHWSKTVPMITSYVLFIFIYILNLIWFKEIMTTVI